jgi:hypothetical protein
MRVRNEDVVIVAGNKRHTRSIPSNLRLAARPKNA